MIKKQLYLLFTRRVYAVQADVLLGPTGSVARSGVLTPKWCFGTPLWCGNFGSGVFIKKGDFSILTSYFH